MQEAEGKSNAQTLFVIEGIPTDNHIRTLLDPVSPEIVYPVFDEAFNCTRSRKIGKNLDKLSYTQKEPMGNIGF